MKYKAEYAKDGVNPFTPNYRNLAGSICFITADVPDNTPLVKVREMAKEATPPGYKFVKVRPVVSREGERK